MFGIFIGGFGGNDADAVVPENQFNNERFYYSVLIAIFILPAIGHLITVMAMKKYPLDDETIQEVSSVF